MKNKCCGVHRPHLNVGSSGSGSSFLLTIFVERQQIRKGS